MRVVRRVGIGLGLAFVPAALLAASSLVLNDGQIIKGTEVRRDGDSYYVTMADGNTAVFPSALVKTVAIGDDAPTAAPPGFDYTGPRTLAGPEIPGNQDPKEQLKVFGPPTQWSKNAVDTTWVPTNAYDPNVDVMAGSRSTWSKNAVDTTWVPTNAYDPNADVMKDTRSTWAKNAVDTTWKPQDGFGFKPLGYKEAETTPAFVAALPTITPYTSRNAPASEPLGPTPWACAETMFSKDTSKPVDTKDNRAASMRVRPVKSSLYASLGLPLYEAEAGADPEPRKAIFTIAAGECRLVGGDSDVVLGLNLTAEHAMTQDGASFNTAMASRGGARVPAGVDKLDYAFALVSLTDPQVSGSRAASLKLISKPEELKTIAADAPAKCSLSKGKRRKEERNAASAFASPKIAAGKEGDVITFLTWSSAGGVLYRNTVVLARGGVVSSERVPLAAHVGAHKD
jgi:hypothetical protein